MIRKIRRHVFETNSSSVHSLAISEKGLERPNLTIKKRKVDGVMGSYIIVPLQYFGKEHCIYDTQEEKLSYLLTIGYCTGSFFDIEDFVESWEFKNLEQQICEYVRQYRTCDGILIEPKTVSAAGIDHQTLSDYYGMESFCKNMSYTTFVFNGYIALETDSD